MADDLAAANVNRSSWTSYTYLASIYFLGVGVLYLWGYWSEFGINVLEYMDVGDILMAASYRIAKAIVWTAFGFIIARIVLPLFSKESAPLPIEFIPHNYRRIMRWTLVGVGVLILAGVYGDVPERWTLTAMVCLLPAYVWAIGSPMGSSITQKLGGRLENSAFVVAALIVLPLYSFGTGYQRARDLRLGNDYQYVAAGSLQGIVPDVISDPERLRFIGKAGELLFFLMPDGDTLLLSRIDQTHGLQLRAHVAGGKQEPAEPPMPPVVPEQPGLTVTPEQKEETKD